jgi:mono/diheme cytochrome c family protein
MSSRGVRLIVFPLILFAAVTALTVGLAKAHLAQPSAPKAAPGGVKLGDPYRGQTVFQQTCATCHGSEGQGGGGGPQIAGTGITVAAAKAQIESPRGVMPAGLVSGQQEADVLAYLAGILPQS